MDRSSTTTVHNTPCINMPWVVWSTHDQSYNSYEGCAHH